MFNVWSKTKILLPTIIRFRHKNRWQRYGFALFLVILTLILKHLTYSYFGTASIFLLLTFAIGLSSLYGGLGPGLLSTFLLAVLNLFFYLSKDFPNHPFSSDLVLTTLFMTEGLLISIVNEARHQVEEEKDAFIGFAAHEIRNPLTTIKGYTQLILKNILSGKHSSKTRPYVREVDKQADRIIELVSDLLDTTKIEVGKFTYTQEYLDIGGLVEAVVDNQLMMNPTRTVHLRGKTKAIVYADKYRMSQVFINLISNALKYSPQTKKIIVTIRKKRQVVLISVKDFGMGIHKDEKEKIFDKYFRTKYAQKEKIEGTGLGLYISSQIVKHHKGKLWVESKMGQGSTFFVQLPMLKK